MRASKSDIDELRTALLRAYSLIYNGTTDDTAGDNTSIEFAEWSKRITLTPNLPYTVEDDNGDYRDVTPDERREWSMAFLAEWTLRFHRAGLKVHKDYGPYAVSVEVDLAGTGWRLRAQVVSEAVCEMVPIVDPESGEPVMEEIEEVDPEWVPPIAPKIKRLVPKTEKVCPPSFLAGAS
jgi:hypothetical protein